MGGGVLIAVSSNLRSEPLSIDSAYDIEFVSVLVKLEGKRIFITCSYIPPNSPHVMYTKHADAIKSVASSAQSNDSVFVFGDFNMPSISWKYLPEDKYCVQTNHNSNFVEFFNTIYDLNLYQINGICNTNSRILDLVFVNDVDDCCIKRSSPITTPEDGYHPTIEVEISTPKYIGALNSKREKVFSFKETNYVMFNELMADMDWHIILSSYNDLDLMINAFYRVIYGIIDLCTPKKTPKVLNGPPWNNKSLAHAKNRKNKLYKKYKRSGSHTDYVLYTVSRAEYSTINKSCYENYISKMKSSFQRNPKDFFAFVNSKKRESGYPTTMKLQQVESSDCSVISNLFADFFSTTYSSAVYNDSNVYPYKITSNQTISMPSIEAFTIFKELLSLKFSYNFGPDKVPSNILINCADGFSIPLTILFNKSLQLGYFPKLWKDSFIIPFYKSGPKADITNYRGIAKLSYIPKLFEKIITDHLCFQVSNIISPYQHGFQKGCSTMTNLLHLTTVIYRGFREQLQTDVIYTDFSKAFDKVNHLLLVQKLRLLGFTDISSKWIYSYLSDRMQTVLFNNSVSRAINVSSGVPQGSHLGPLLFSLFINDLPQVITSSNILMYADDVKVFLSYCQTSDQQLLQKDLDSISNWCEKNFMQLNLKKCKYMRFVRRQPFLAQYYLNCCELELVDNFLDLGILLDTKLNFIAHINMIANKARGVLGFVKRWSKEFKDPYVTKCLYTSLVRPVLEYGSIIWDPLYKKHSDVLESVQKQFLLFCLRGLNFDPMHLPPYTSRLGLIKLPTLKSRRIVLNISFLFNVVTGDVCSGFLINNITFNVPHRPTRYFALLSIEFVRSNYADADPLRRMCKDFNKFYSYIDFSSSPQLIKKNILIFLNS